jgi:predicted Zn-dependent protease
VDTRATNRKWWRPAGGAGVLAVALALAACSSMPGGRQIFLPDLPKNADVNSQSVREEHQRVLAAYGGVYEDPKLHTRLTDIVERLTKGSDQPNLHYKITILNSPAVNAFALPNGQLYVTRGLLALANDSAEVASVMSHEMAHVIKGHAAIREAQARKTQVAAPPAGDPDVSLPMALARSKLALAGFSRSQETEADTIGVAIAAHAGFDPYGAARLLKAMGRNAQLRAGGRDLRSLEFMSSHPETMERATNASNSARSLAGGPGARTRDKATYLQSIDGMKYGDDTDEGFVRGRHFMHPKLGFTFMAPEGFTLDNTAQAVLGLKESTGQAFRLDVVKVPAEKSLIEYINSGWIENIDNGSVEEVSVNGLQAATATAGGDQPWRYRLYVVKFGSEVYRFVFAARNRAPEAGREEADRAFRDPDRSFRESVQTFRRLSEREKATRPLRLKVVKVQPGDTVDSLAAGMAVADHQVERFRVLNGMLESNDELKVGDLVKIVVE